MKLPSALGECTPHLWCLAPLQTYDDILVPFLEFFGIFLELQKIPKDSKKNSQNISKKNIPKTPLQTYDDILVPDLYADHVFG